MERARPQTFVRFLVAGMTRAPRHLWSSTKTVEATIGIALFIVAVLAFAAGLIGWFVEEAPDWLASAGWAGVVVLLLAFLRGLYDVYEEERDQRAQDRDKELERIRIDRDGYKRNCEDLHPAEISKRDDRIKELEAQVAGERPARECAALKRALADLALEADSASKEPDNASLLSIIDRVGDLLERSQSDDKRRWEKDVYMTHTEDDRGVRKQPRATGRDFYLLARKIGKWQSRITTDRFL